MLHVGRAEITLVGHVALLAPCCGLVAIQPWPAGERSSMMAMLVLVYALLQGGRILHELGHALVGHLCGRQLLRIRFTLALMAVWFPDDDPPNRVRWTALAGSLVQAAFGVAVLLV